jgi:hypothetical protein
VGKLIEKKSAVWWDQAPFNHLRKQMPPGLRWVRVVRAPRLTPGKIIAFTPLATADAGIRTLDLSIAASSPPIAPLPPSEPNCTHVARPRRAIALEDEAALTEGASELPGHSVLRRVLQAFRLLA